MGCNLMRAPLFSFAAMTIVYPRLAFTHWMTVTTKEELERV